MCGVIRETQNEATCSIYVTGQYLILNVMKYTTLIHQEKMQDLQFHNWVIKYKKK